MKTRNLIVMISTLLLTISSTLMATETQTIKIEGIRHHRSDNYISGTVQGLSREEVDQYKVVVFVKPEGNEEINNGVVFKNFDWWYIHSFVQVADLTVGESLSFSSIDTRDGSWQIKAVRRPYVRPAEWIRAFLVKSDCFPYDAAPILKDRIGEGSECDIIVEDMIAGDGVSI